MLPQKFFARLWRRLSQRFSRRLSHLPLYRLLWIAGLLALACTWVVIRALAGPAQGIQGQASPIHPTFALLDVQGKNVLESGAPLSTMQTCGQCHDAAFVESHSFHADLGRSALTAAGQTGSGRPWDVSNGLFGKFDPLTYGYLSQPGDERLDLSTAGWLMAQGARVPGGGPGVYTRDGQPLTELPADVQNPEASVLDPATGLPAAWDWSQSGVLEMDCLLCHTAQPNAAARAEAIQAGRFGEASAATLLGSGVVEKKGNDWAYNPAAFDEAGELKAEFVRIQDPTNENCAQCHGVVHADPQTPLVLNACDLSQPQTAATGQVIASQRINESGLNLADKESLSRAWDIHAERGLKCTDCHYSLNNPTHASEALGANPAHLTYDPRRLELGEYLEKPDHNLARGQSAQFTVAPELKGTMRRCESCHDAPKTHADWLPYAERHMQVVACETCHAPQMYAPAIEAYDWTVIKTDGAAVSSCRGIDGANTVTDLVSGYQPALMQRKNVDGNTLLAPYNLVTAWYWTYEDAAGNRRPVRKLDLEAAFLADGGYTPEILMAFDANGDKILDDGELRIDSRTKQLAVMGRLEAQGLKNPEIYGQVQPYSINHNIARGEAVISDCQTCHADDSRLAAPMRLAAYTPGSVTPEFVSDANVAASGELYNQDGALYYRPATEKDDVYAFGHNRIGWVDVLGALAFVGVLLGVGAHGTLRYLASLKRPKRPAKTKAVYMYDTYERFWHWLQTFAIIILLFTGLVIHRPDMFGLFSFRYMVVVHNALAVVLVINAGLSLFWHLASGEIRQFIPRPYGFFDNAIVQTRFYIQGIFKGGEHPFEKKLNPLQQLTYFGLLNVLLPLQMITGALMWGVQQWPQIAGMLGGLPFLAPFHSLVAWLLGAFIVAHVYLTTTGATVFEDIKAMVTGWENVEVHEEHEAESPDQPAQHNEPELGEGAASS
jgi:thiosulfate reductase cytochrome b subunit